MTNSSSKIWRMQKKRYRLVGLKCSGCKRIFYPPRTICSHCTKPMRLDEVKLSGRGKVISWSLIHVAPKGFEQLTPYLIALVKLDEGPVILSQVTDHDLKAFDTGVKVEIVFRKLFEPEGDGIICYGLKFRPIDR